VFVQEYPMFIDAKYADSVSGKWFAGNKPSIGEAMAELRRDET